jgi:hypothetical protein
MDVLFSTFLQGNQSLLKNFNTYFFNNLSVPGLILVGAIFMHLCKLSSIRHILDLDMTFFIKLNSC